MGQAKRRKALLGDEYGKIQKSNGHTSTPKAITDDVLKFCQTIGQSAPFVLDVPSGPFAMGAGTCHYNVARRIEKEGGSAQYGWVIWERPNVMLEADFHCVWIDPSGAMRDVTEQPDGEKQIVFMPDNSRAFDFTGRTKPSEYKLYWPLQDDDIIKGYIVANQQMSKNEVYVWKDGIMKRQNILTEEVQAWALAGLDLNGQIRQKYEVGRVIVRDLE
jgi:hypothetical protein